MATRNLESRIARLRQELEKLSAQHAEKMKQLASTANAKLRAAEAKRAEILARRIRHLNEMLEARRREKSN